MGVEGLLQQFRKNKMKKPDEKIAKDVKKEETLKEVRKRIGVQFDDRRNFLNAIMNIQNTEKSIELQKQFIEQMEDQKKTGKIEERDRFGNILTLNHLKREISANGFKLGQMELNLDYCKEDMFNKFHGNEGLIDRAGSVEKLKENIAGHYKFVREEYEKIKEKLK